MTNWKEREKQALRASLETETTKREGALFWLSNGQPVPMHVFQDAGVVAPEGQQQALDVATQAFLKEYRKQDHTPTEEQLFEMRAAFGTGCTVVDVITGKRTRL